MGSEFLAPGYHSYDFHVQANVYDVTGHLRPGTNEWEVWLGDGWYRGRLGFDGGYTRLYGDRCYCIAELYTGEELAVKTDGSWQSRPSPVTFSNIYDGGCFYHENFRTAKTEFTQSTPASKKSTGCSKMPCGDRRVIP